MKAAVLAVFAFASPIAAQTLSQEIGTNGIAPTLARLKAQPEPALEDIFAIGGLQFLAGVEHALQLQWRTGMNDAAGDLGEVLDMPFLRLPIPSNPAAQPFEGKFVTQLFTNLDADMQAARSTLATLPEGEDFGLEIDSSDLWFDVNANGIRDTGEEAAVFIGRQLMGRPKRDTDLSVPEIIVRFDAADSAWLAAYAHMLSGTANLILAYDPAASIDRAVAARAALGETPSEGVVYIDTESIVDAIAMMEGALNQSPDRGRTKAAKAHFLAMIAENRRFWSLVAQETDNDREWIPNAAQTSALGIVLPPETAATWLAVLADGEALLQGRLLAPYWRGRPDQGIDIGMMLDDPAPVSLMGWAQGWGALAYLKKGRVADGTNLRQFETLMGGSGTLMMVLLN